MSSKRPSTKLSTEHFALIPCRIATALALVLALSSGTAVAQERDATAAERERVVSHLTSLGYSRIVDVDVVRNTFEADARSPEGLDVDVILDRETLAIVRVERS